MNLESTALDLAVARRVMGTTVIGGMLAATALFFIPVTYYVMSASPGSARATLNRRWRQPRLRR